MFDVLPVPFFVVILLVLALAVPFRLPRVGAVLGLAAVALGAGLFLFPESSGFWKELFEEINRALGIYLMTYGGLWVAIGGTRWWTKRPMTPVPV